MATDNIALPLRGITVYVHVLISTAMKQEKLRAKLILTYSGKRRINILPGKFTPAAI
jgi:N-acetyl-gamma-glutamylphosphate reductase